MAAQVWGTFSVNDHTRPNAFVREVLLFDRLVLPYPRDQLERDRWRAPNPASPAETWNPERLDALISILGSQEVAGQNGARLTWTAPWSEQKWRFERSRLDVASTISDIDTFAMSRLILANDEELPGLVEAVAAFPSERAWRDELRPADEPVEDVTAAQALVLLAWPLLTPADSEGTDFRPLRAAVELAQEDDYRAMRTAYHNWMRKLVGPLQGDADGRLSDTALDAGSLKLLQEEFEHLIDAQERIVRRDRARKSWERAEFATTAVGGAASTVMAFLNPLAVFGVLAAALQFGGYVAGKRAGARAEPPALGGASMFPTVRRRLSEGSRPWWKSLLGAECLA